MTEKRPIKILPIVNLVAFLATIVVNALANILPLNGNSTGDLSDSYPNLFVPAGITFAVWGVIYLLLGIYAIVQMGSLKKGTGAEYKYVEKIGWWFVISSGANIAWIFFWHYELVELSLVAMLILLVSLIAIYLRLKIGRNDTKGFWAQFNHEIPFSIYLGWITVATIANVTAVLVNIGWSGWGISQALWTVIVIVTAILITGLMLWLRKDVAYALVVIWATLGIYIKRTSAPVAEPLVSTTALIAVILISIGAIITLIIQLKKK